MLGGSGSRLRPRPRTTSRKHTFAASETSIHRSRTVELSPSHCGARLNWLNHEQACHTVHNNALRKHVLFVMRVRHQREAPNLWLAREAGCL